ncbi:topoisomerase I [Microbacterium sp. CH12i]|uniref:DNA topoisomerase IB n=1 Tax=Microbacterium sp. CH12i TaxID=1479651 RepID=UPI0004613767|nr:DNA topoisomerase IB [Microbacterium sp. CH12i]KDA05954.1 topoisomerase I [Microbacterium sp. CH12i]
MVRLLRVRAGVDPGLRRVRAGTGFRYIDWRGDAPARLDLERIHDLAIPPAWTDVWISVDPLAHIQTVGTDKAGRRQYIYHPAWRTRHDRRKFSRALMLASTLPLARARVTKALRRDEPDREHALAVSFRILDTAAPRVGSTRYLTLHGSRGLTTLQRRDARVEASTVTLSFPAKSGKRAHLDIVDQDLATAIGALNTGRQSSPLLWYQRGRRQVPLRPAEVNAHVRDVTGGAFTAKDFRTLRGTIIAAEALARIGPVDTKRDRKHAEVLAVSAAADGLGNTPAIARASYIDPRVFRQYARGHLLDLGVSPERAIRALLDGVSAG